jgi:RHS repeat-associated protein
MTTAAICASREALWRSSFYRGEQYDPDLGLYYLRARYYNPLTGRFMSRDPKGGVLADPASLHKYLYANGDPVDGWDPTGRGDEADTAYLDLAAVVRTAPIVIGFGLDISQAYCLVATTFAAYALLTHTEYIFPKVPTVVFCLGVTWGRFGFPGWWGSFPGLGG